MVILIPETLREVCRESPSRAAWLSDLSRVIEQLARDWSISEVGNPVEARRPLSWVAPVTLQGGHAAVLKIGIPHMEGEDEICGLRFWAGDPTVFLVDADESRNAMLLERCIPGTPLRSLPAKDQDQVIARLLRRIWRPVPGQLFRPVSVMTDYWAAETHAASDEWPDRELVLAGLAIFRELSAPAAHDVSLVTDLHAGNVLRAEREPWLVIDPKPFLGDPCYDATQHLMNSQDRLLSDWVGTINGFAELLDLSAERIRLWLFARLAAEPRDVWSSESQAMARRLGV